MSHLPESCRPFNCIFTGSSRPKAPQYWLHPKACPVMGVQFVEENIARKLGQEIEIVDDVAFNILYKRPDVVLNFIKRHL